MSYPARRCGSGRTCLMSSLETDIPILKTTPRNSIFGRGTVLLLALRSVQYLVRLHYVTNALVPYPYVRARDISWVCGPTIDGSGHPKNLMQLFEHFPVLPHFIKFIGSVTRHALLFWCCCPASQHVKVATRQANPVWHGP
jgi:hypothetical protein